MAFKTPQAFVEWQSAVVDTSDACIYLVYYTGGVVMRGRAKGFPPQLPKYEPSAHHNARMAPRNTTGCASMLVA